MLWGAPTLPKRPHSSDFDSDAGAEEGYFRPPAKTNRFQRRDTRSLDSTEQTSLWFRELFAAREKPKKRRKRRQKKLKRRHCSCRPQSSQECGLVLLGMLLFVYLVDFFSLLYTDTPKAFDGQTNLQKAFDDSGRAFRRGNIRSINDNGNEFKNVLVSEEDDSRNQTLLAAMEGGQNSTLEQSHLSDVRSTQNVDSGQLRETIQRKKQRHIHLAISPMNRNMLELQVPAHVGRMTIVEVRAYYRRLAKAYLFSFSNGIYRQMYFDVLRRRTYSLTPPGANKGVQTILFQIVNGRVFMMDPYEVPRNSKPFYRTRINQVIWLLSKLATEHRIRDTEFLMAIHDCVQTVDKPHNYRGAHYQESNPAFTIVTCNFSDNIPFPMWEGSKHRDGGFSDWDVTVKRYAQDDIPWEQKQDRAVFRGGNRPSMFFKNKSEADFHCHDVGRTRLHHLSLQQPDVLDVSIGGTCGGIHTRLDRLEPREHHRYKYILYAEGNCMWADRSRTQVFGPSVIIKQETPCGQFFEPLMKPNVHYIPTDFFFTDTIEKVLWARAHDELVRKIASRANDFAHSFLSLDGIEAYVEVLLDEYTKLLVEPEIKVENGAVEVTNKTV